MSDAPTDSPLNGGVDALHLDADSAPASPAPADSASPATPVSNSLLDSVKIDLSHNEPLDQTRDEEPLALKLDVVSVQPELATPVDPDTIPIDPPKGTPPPPVGQLLPDVEMSERADEPNGITLGTEPVDSPMADPEPVPDVASPYVNGHADADPHPNGDAVDASAAASERRSADHLASDEDAQLPPAKRARKHSDADQASFAHSAAPPPAAHEPHAGPSTLSASQFKFCMSTVRSLKKLKDATPFLRPVDPVALNIPHYPTIVKHPIDFGTIERKLASSNPAKPDPISENPRYHTADEFVADVRLIFHNCLTFNGPEHLVTAMGKRVEAVFDKQIKQLPPADEPKPVVKKIATPTPPPPPPPPKKTAPARRPSTSVPTIRRSDEAPGRPKREIHPPPPKDLPYADVPKRTRKHKSNRDDGTGDQLKFCSKVLSDLYKKQYWSIANPFYEPVDWVKLEIPAYPKIIKKPMDLSTMRKKLDSHEYSNPQKFHDDFKLMIRNCFAFNPAGTPVNQAGIELQRLFDDKWKGLPALRELSDGDDDEADDEEEEERARTIAAMENQMETMRANLAALKGKPVEEKKKKKKPVKNGAPPVASTSKATKPSKSASSASISKKKKGNQKLAEDDVLSFDQKKDLSDAISQLDGTKLEKVIQIIHEGVPEIRDSTEEIELEIDSLPASVLTKLYNFVIRPVRNGNNGAGPKRNRAGKGGGTGGLKRKSMDEDVEAEKIRQLEERMRLFEQDNAAAAGQTVSGGGAHSESDSSSGSDSSGSDSE